MDELSTGWVRWGDNKPVEHRIGRVIDKFVPPQRRELGYDNKDDWPADDRGEVRDPWQFTNYLVLKSSESRRVLHVHHRHSRRSQRRCGPVPALRSRCQAAPRLLPHRCAQGEQLRPSGQGFRARQDPGPDRRRPGTAGRSADARCQGHGRRNSILTSARLPCRRLNPTSTNSLRRQLQDGCASFASVTTTSACRRSPGG